MHNKNITHSMFPPTAECPVLSAPAFGSVSITGRRPGDTATYRCNTGFELIGPDTRVCGETDPGMADWDGEEPICRRMFPSLSLTTVSYSTLLD